MERSQRRARAIAIAKTDETNRLQARLLTVAAAVSLTIVCTFAAFQFA